MDYHFLLSCQKKVSKEKRGRLWKSRLRIRRERSGKRELAPRFGSSLKQRVFTRSVRWMRDGAFPVRPPLFHSHWSYSFEIPFVFFRRRYSSIMREPQQLQAKEVSHMPVVLQCGATQRYPLQVRLEYRAEDIVEICHTTHDGLVAVEVDGEKLFGTVPYVSCDGKQCFVYTDLVDAWFPTEELQRWNCGLSLAYVPGDGRLGVKGWTATIGAMIVSVMVMRGCDNGSKIVLPKLSEPAAGQGQ